MALQPAGATPRASFADTHFDTPEPAPASLAPDEDLALSRDACLPSATVPDWSRERCAPWAWQPGRQLLRSLRAYQRARRSAGPVATLAAKLAVLGHRFWSSVSGAEIPLNANIGGGLHLPHPNGVVVHPEATLGPNCVLFHQVTIGTGPRPGVPRLGGHVDVGPGAKILGGVTIGDHAIIGANAVVLNDVPSGGVAVGIPAVTTRRR